MTSADNGEGLNLREHAFLVLHEDLLKEVFELWAAGWFRGGNDPDFMKANRLLAEAFPWKRYLPQWGGYAAIVSTSTYRWLRRVCAKRYNLDASKLYEGCRFSLEDFSTNDFC